MRPEPDPGEIGDDNDDEPLHHYVDGNATELISILLKSACAGFDTGRAANRKHSDKRVFEHQTAMSLQHRSGTQAAYRTFNKFRSDALHNDTHTRAIKKLADPEDKQHSLTAYETGGDTRPLWRRRTDIINTQFADAVNNLMNTAEPAGLFSDPVIAAIDVTTVEVDYTLWKDEDEIEDDDRRVVVNSKTGETKVPRDDISPLLRGKMDEDNYGTELHYATLTAVAGNMPVILGAFPIRHDSFWEEDGTTIRSRLT